MGTVLVFVAGVLSLVTFTYSYSTGSLHLYGCQGRVIPKNLCTHESAIYEIKSISVLTSHDTDDIRANPKECFRAEECRRTIYSVEDKGLSDDYIHLYNWVLSRCKGKPSCDDNSTMPEWWALTDDFTECGQGNTQHFVGVLIDITCKVGETIVTVQPPPDTTPKTRPTTPTTTTAFPVFIPVYQPELNSREKVILGVAIGLAIIILLVLLIVLYCCERYRNSKKIGKLMRMLGAPQAQDDVFDELDYGKSDAWKEETNANYDALGEYTGVKPDEFLTLGKREMINSGQIMYDANVHTMTMGRGNSCSTLSKKEWAGGQPTGPTINYGHNGPMNYETAENLDLEKRMAETLNTGPSLEEDTSYH